MERKLQEELEGLKSQLLAMSAKVERNIEDAVRALIKGGPGVGSEYSGQGCANRFRRDRRR